MSFQVWHQPESGRIASKLQVARGWKPTFPALPACRRVGVSACRPEGPWKLSPGFSLGSSPQRL